MNESKELKELQGYVFALVILQKFWAEVLHKSGALPKHSLTKCFREAAKDIPNPAVHEAIRSIVAVLEHDAKPKEKERVPEWLRDVIDGGKHPETP